MTRKEFLEKLGLGAAFALTATCLGSCGKDSTVSPTADVDFTLNLLDNANTALQNPGGYLIRDRVVIARTNDNEFVAATQVCSHENLAEIIYLQGEWFCTAHDARFDLNGQGLNANGSRGLTIYNTSLNSDILRVFS